MPKHKIYTKKDKDNFMKMDNNPLHFKTFEESTMQYLGSFDSLEEFEAEINKTV